MTTAELKEYLEMVVGIESELYTLQQEEDELTKEIRVLEDTKWEEFQLNRPFEDFCLVRESKEDFLKDIEPQKIVLTKPVAPSMPDFLNWESKPTVSTIIMLASLILACVILPPIMIVGVPYVLYKWTQKEKEMEEKYRRDCETYRRNLREYNEYCEENKKKEQRRAQLYSKWNDEKIKLQAEITRKKLLKEAYDEVLQNLKKQENKARKVCAKIYSAHVIYGKYCNYVAVCSFYDYVASGRCSALEGADGAYNKYELEIRMDKIIVQLDKVIKNLELIRSNQYKLYIEMKNAENELKRIHSSVNHISEQMNTVIVGMEAIYAQNERNNERLNAQMQMIRNQTEELIRNSGLSAYFAECNQRELHYMNRMNYLAGHYDNPYGSYAPV